MNIQIQTMPDSVIKMEITISPQEIARVAQDLEKHHKLTSEQIANLNQLPAILQEELVTIYFRKAMEKHPYAIVTEPRLTIINQQPFIFTVEFTTLPNIQAPNYKDIKIEKQTSATVTKKEIKNILNHLQRQAGKKTVAKHPAQKSDMLIINFTGIDENGIVAMANKKHLIFLLTGQMLQEFDQELIGAKKGDIKKFDLQLPDNFTQIDLRGKTLHFTVKILDVYEVEPAPLNDELAHKILGAGKTLDDLMTNIKNQLEKDKTIYTRQHNEKAVLEKIIAMTQVKVPSILIERELDGLVESFYKNLEIKGLSREKLDKILDKEKRDPRKQLYEQAKKNVILQLALDKILAGEEFKIYEEALKKAAKKYVTAEMSEEKILKNNDMVGTITREWQLKKLLDKILDNI